MLSLLMVPEPEPVYQLINDDDKYAVAGFTLVLMLNRRERQTAVHRPVCGREGRRKNGSNYLNATGKLIVEGPYKMSFSKCLSAQTHYFLYNYAETGKIFFDSNDILRNFAVPKK